MFQENIFALVSMLLDEQEDRWLANATNTTTATTTTTVAKTSKYAKFYLIYTSVVIALMFLSLIFEVLLPDMAMVCALTALMTAGCVTIPSGLAGFGNTGVLTVLSLFPLAQAITLTGGLDWYMQKILGRPKSNIDAQIRLMVPNIILSAFIHNTPLVMVMLPIVEGWSKGTGIPVGQLMMPLSVAAIFGGTTTLLGTTTNIIVTGLLEKNYPKDKKIGMFDMGLYGVPLCFVGLAYTLLASPFTLPGGRFYIGRKNRPGVAATSLKGDDLLFGARLSKWSPAAGRSVKRSGLRNTGGVYLVSVYRTSTGNVHRAVGRDFVLNEGDILYFTGLYEEFAHFCEENSLEIITDEFHEGEQVPTSGSLDGTKEEESPTALLLNREVPPQVNGDEVGLTRESIVYSDESERWRIINNIVDVIRGETLASFSDNQSAPSRIVIASDHATDPLIVVAISAPDRPGLLLDISKAFKRLHINFKSTEAKVVGYRSLSVWRVEVLPDGPSDIEHIWSVLHALLEEESGIEAVKHRGLTVVRAKVTPKSSLIGKTAAESDFRGRFRAGIIAWQRALDDTQVRNFSEATFADGDVLILQVSDESPLLQAPPENLKKRASLLKSIVSNISNKEEDKDELKDWNVELARKSSAIQQAFEDLEVSTSVGTPVTGENVTTSAEREFLMAFKVPRRSRLIRKSARQGDIVKLKGVYLVSIERPKDSAADSLKQDVEYAPLSEDDPLQEGDLLWYTGSAISLGDLRKVPGIVSYEANEIKSIKARVFDRRLVQAVVAKGGTLVGKTVKEAQFRTKYSAAVIAVNRQGKKVDEHPGQVRLLAGDVLLLEAGVNFIKQQLDNDKSFALIYEIKDSTPPRLRHFLPAIFFASMMIFVSTAWPSIDLLITTLIAVILMAATGVISANEIRQSFIWDLYITIAGAFGVGNAMSSSGLAAAIANGIVKVATAANIGDAGIVGGVYLAAFLISQVLTNNAAAALAFPIAMSVAKKYNYSRRTLAYSVMFAASASFSTPFGYTTNLLVYGPGGYNTLDYFIFGVPLNLLFWIYTTAILVAKDPWIFWIFTMIPVSALVIVIFYGTAIWHKFFRRDKKNRA